MIWACFCWHGQGSVTKCSNKMNCNDYSRYWGNMSNLQWIFIFLTEIESFRTTMLAFIGLEKWKIGLEHSVDHFMYWPPSSPDLNPIENLWDELERKLWNSSPLSRTLPDLEERLLQLWPEVDLCRLKNIVDSMPSRIKVVIKAKGGPIDY